MISIHTDDQAIALLRDRLGDIMPQRAAILGSGWRRVLERATIIDELSFEDWLGVKPGVPGHDGRLVIAEFDQVRVAVMAGRIHPYEGFTTHQATLPIRSLAAAGVNELVVTAAAGGLNPRYQVGDFVLLSDMLTLFLGTDVPLQGPAFQDLSMPFDEVLRTQARLALVKAKVRFHEGVYNYFHGPHFETPTDKMALRFLGADVTGMSTVHEVIAARWHRMRVVGLALVTNLAFVQHDHQQVLAAATAASDAMSEILSEYFRLIDQLK